MSAWSWTLRARWPVLMLAQETRTEIRPQFPCFSGASFSSGIHPPLFLFSLALLLMSFCENEEAELSGHRFVAWGHRWPEGPPHPCLSTPAPAQLAPCGTGTLVLPVLCHPGSRDRKSGGRLSSPKPERQRGQNSKAPAAPTDRWVSPPGLRALGTARWLLCHREGWRSFPPQVEASITSQGQAERQQGCGTWLRSRGKRAIRPVFELCPTSGS